MTFNIKSMPLIALLFLLVNCKKDSVSPEVQLRMSQLNDTSIVKLFIAGKDGYAAYRIPSIVTTNKQTILAFCEGRKYSLNDNGNVDIVMKRSVDGGNTWSDLYTIQNDANNTCGNPCAVVDEKTEVIWLLSTHNLGSDAENAIINKTAKETRTVWVSKSKDDGLTWSAPVNITKTTKDTSWGWYATGPGIGIQLKYGNKRGRLIIPCDHSYSDPNGNLAGGHYEYAAHIIYSDDHGITWKLGGSIMPKLNESQITEMADAKGGLLINMRSYTGNGCREHATSSTYGNTWESPFVATALIEPVCQASILRYSWPMANQKSCILFLNPANSSQRINMTIKASYDEGKTWPSVKSLYSGPSAYSCMTVMSDGSIGCLYEAGVSNPNEMIIFQKMLPHIPF